MGLIPEDIIAQVIDRTDIVETINGFTPLKRAGRNFKGLCPFHHEKTPSFIVNPDKQIFHCFGCAVGGNVVHFLMKQERLEFPEAVRQLAQKAGIVIPETEGESFQDSLRQKIFQANDVAVNYFHNNLLTGKEPEVGHARDYLKARSISLECVKKFKIGYAYDKWDELYNLLKQKGFDAKVIEKSGLVVARENNKGLYDRFRGRVIFSIFDSRGRALAFGARALKKDDRAKYINSPETPVYTKGQHLYGFNLSKESVGREDAAVVVEGYMDFIRPFFAGVENVAASLGTALTVDQIRIIRRYTRNVIMLYDMDSAGQMATLRSLDSLLEEDMNVRIATLAADEDPDSFILKYGVEKFKDCLHEAKSLFDFKFDLLKQKFGSDTIEAKGKICRELIPTIDKVPSEVVKSGYYRELSQRLKVSESAVLKERDKLFQKNAAPEHGVGNPGMTKEKKPFYADEAVLLKLMLMDSRWVTVARDAHLTPESFRTQELKLIVAKLFELLTSGQEPTPRALVARLEDEALRDFVTAQVSDETLLKSQERIFNDCLKRVQKTEQKARRERLREEIKLAETLRDHEKVLKLQKEFNQLIKGVEVKS
ncbi:MAG: DNA primase [Candidatus Omnitrophica bacterium]|nr:DNA primase [Candidatus Omnitrophota bacterium]